MGYDMHARSAIPNGKHPGVGFTHRDLADDPDFISKIPEDVAAGWDQHRVPYLGLNIWGMRACRDAMTEGGVLDHETPLPHHAEAWNEVQLATRSADPNKVPAFKFCSNDGWIVTPEECHLIARLVGWLDANPAPEVDLECARPFVEFNRVCTDLGGYVVI